MVTVVPCLRAMILFGSVKSWNCASPSNVGRCFFPLVFKINRVGTAVRESATYHVSGRFVEVRLLWSVQGCEENATLT